jgi:hypothetical protein
MRPPPSREQWAIQGEMEGHTVEQTIRWLSDTADWQDELARRRTLPVVAVPTVGEAWRGVRGWLRRVLR